MWAGGSLTFHTPIPLGAELERHSTIEAVTAKTGRSGSMVFLTLHHQVRVGGKTAVEEQQGIVYREMPARDNTSVTTTAPPAPETKLPLPTWAKVQLPGSSAPVCQRALSTMHGRGTRRGKPLDARSQRQDVHDGHPRVGRRESRFTDVTRRHRPRRRRVSVAPVRRRDSRRTSRRPRWLPDRSARQPRRHPRCSARV
jgi:hypothetical protein